MTTYAIPDMSCSHCKATVLKTITAIDPTATLNFDMPARTVAVHSAASTDDTLNALTAAGYPATVL